MKRFDESEKKDIARKIITGDYCVLDTEEKIKCGAMPLLLGGLKDMPQEEMLQVGVVLGDATTAARSCNGIPCCFSITLVHKDDWRDIIALHNKALEVLT